MKKLFLAFLGAAASVCMGADDYFNGGFEVCAPDTSGVAMPVGWVSNRAVTRNGKARLIRESGCFRSGSFGLLAETEAKGSLSFRSLKRIGITQGDTLELEIYAKGSGKYSVQYIVYGVEDEKHHKFLTTLGTGRGKQATEETWQHYTAKIKFTPPPKARGKYEKYTVIPVIFVHGDAEIIFDDFKLKITPKK